MPELVGGSADLNPSCFTYIKEDKDFQKGHYNGRNIRFGVREHSMIAIVNGLAAYGAYLPYGSTFFNFIGYALGAVTLGALSGFRALYIMTHDSITLGEDGPTHQPVEKINLCRETPNLLFIRPADGNEVSAAYAAAISQHHRPSVLALSRQNVPNLEGSSFEGALKGAYVIRDIEHPDIILVATGSEVSLAIDTAKKLDIKARVVSFPSWELFEEQPLDYRVSVFPAGVPVLAIEPSTINGWYKYAHSIVGMTSFGASGPIPAVYKKFGFTVENVSAKAKALVEFYKKTPIPHLIIKPAL